MRFFTTIADFFAEFFISPIFFAFLGLIPIVILLYLLKLRRTEVVISSTLLWMKSLQELTANAPFQRLRKNLLMFLQILVLLLVVLALARPFFRSEDPGGKNLCIVIDRSASMQTLEDGQARIEIARDKALELVNNLKRGDKAMVIAFSEKSDVMCELTDDRFHLRRAINSIRPADTKTRIRDVMFITSSLSPDNPDVTEAVSNLELVLFSDGKIDDLKGMDMPAIKLNYVQVGSNTNNAGIIAFSARDAQEFSEDQQTFTLVHNAHDTALESTLSLYLDDALLAVEEIEVPPGEDSEVVFTHTPLEHGVLKVVLDHEDDLAADNTAWLALRPAARIRTLLVSDPASTSSYFIKRALSLEPRVELSALIPADYQPSDEYDLTIFDGFAPPELPMGSFLFFNALPTDIGADLSLGEDIEMPPVINWDSDHPVMRFLNPANIGISLAKKMSMNEGSRSMMTTEGGPLIADISRDGRQIIVAAFDLGDSNWPLRLSFPLFMQNLVTWVPRATLAKEASVSTGGVLTLLPVQEINTAEVTTPDRKKHDVELDPMRAVFFGATEDAGIYKVARGEDVENFAVNLLDRNESSIGSVEKLSIGSGEVLAEPGKIRHNKELWRWLLLVALLVLTLEWYIYSRRAWL